ncbi:hypothetical protein KAR48_03005 [bacterium]|nr:hypothetical protein [bacterium]
MRDRYKIFDEEGVYLLTSTIIEWLPIFTSRIYLLEDHSLIKVDTSLF